MKRGDEVLIVKEKEPIIGDGILVWYCNPETNDVDARLFSEPFYGIFLGAYSPNNHFFAVWHQKENFIYLVTHAQIKEVT